MQLLLTCDNCQGRFWQYKTNRILKHIFCHRQCDIEYRKKHYFDKFIKKTFTKEDGCWGWKGQISSAGYAIFLGKPAHRFSYFHFKGVIPQGLFVLHKCDNRSCTNPIHLELGDQRKNLRDCSERGRISRGSQRPNHKLVESQIAKIRKSYSEGHSQVKLALEYNVSPKNIFNIVHKLRWKHI